MNTYVKAGLLGIFAGMRSMAGPALISHVFTNHGYRRIRKSPFKFLGRTGTSNALKAITIGEFIIDKIPGIPSRTAPGLLAARITSGALSGAAVSLAEKKKLILGLILGGTAAAGSAYLFRFFRDKAGKKSGVSNTIAGLAEDAVLIGSGLTVLSKGF